MISVVLPTYNRGRCIARAINSVLNQTYSDIELIVVDDGSTDNTKEIVESYTDARVRYIYQENAGACAARNRGIDEAIGEYIAFQDSDDEWRKDKLDIQLRALQENNTDIVFSGFIRRTEGEEGFEFFPPSELKPNGFATICDILPGNICTTATILLKKECLIMDRFNEKLPRLQEWELMLRLFPKWRVFYVDDNLATVYLQNDSISRNRTAYLEALEYVNYLIGLQYKQEHQKFIQMKEETDNLQTQLEEAKRDGEYLRLQLADLQRQFSEVLSSRSWRITEPFRVFVDLFRQNKV
ncbi:MAG: glycosyltransferase family 2 protein [Clostridiales bacterium]|nr:glycosyltransferase family 2 protein [Clostridiales bacterium]